ncbi:AtMMH-1 [Amanita muscaria]
MPELPVERAVRLLRSIGVGKTICKVETTEDKLVFMQTTHDQFAAEIVNRTIQDVCRYGKVFYLELNGKGRTPVLHFGMTGNLQVRGEEPLRYQESPKRPSVTWPPKYMKFVLHLADEASNVTAEVAFMDARRLGRIRLCISPTAEPPISELGFDPILSMPSMTDFLPMVRRRTCPVKALLLDQSFSAGVGNWVADEILYHARIHPEQRCNTLTDDQLNALHNHITDVCSTAVAVNADSQQFPENWLFRYRWGKGKKKTDAGTLILPNGEPATIKWVTVGGRTSAYIVELQRLPSNADLGLSNEPQPVSRPLRGGKRKRLVDDLPLQQPSKR